jgi:hypothetical protein
MTNIMAGVRPENAENRVSQRIPMEKQPETYMPTHFSRR